jgi:hypothetical protein
MNGIAKSRKENIHQEKENDTHSVQNCQNHNSKYKDNNHNSISIGEVDPWTAWIYKPHTISLLLCGTCLLMSVYCTFSLYSLSVLIVANVTEITFCIFNLLVRQVVLFIQKVVQ